MKKQKPRQSVFLERLIIFVEEAIFLPLEDFAIRVAAKYPETSRSGYRYIRYPILKVIVLSKPF